MQTRKLALAAFACLAVPMAAQAAPLYSDNFTTSAATDYTVFTTAGLSPTVGGGKSSDATFQYDYSALGIPAAPHTTDGSTLGVRLRADTLQNAAAAEVVGAASIVTKGLNLPSTFTVSVDVWANYLGSTSIASSGSNGTTGLAVGVGTKGTSIQSIVSNDGLLVEGFGDNAGGADGAYRVYTGNTSPRPVPTNSSYYAAGTTAGSATFSNAYYTSLLPSVSAPTAQSTAAPGTQGGTSAAGTLGFAWHTYTIVGDGTNYIWSIDGKVITTVPYANMTLTGGQVSLANIDTGTGGNATTAGQTYNFELFDNLVITPEPTSLVALAGAGVVAFRRRK